jgi:hypothetical protein
MSDGASKQAKGRERPNAGGRTDYDDANGSTARDQKKTEQKTEAPLKADDDNNNRKRAVFEGKENNGGGRKSLQPASVEEPGTKRDGNDKKQDAWVIDLVEDSKDGGGDRKGGPKKRLEQKENAVEKSEGGNAPAAATAEQKAKPNPDTKANDLKRNALDTNEDSRDVGGDRKGGVKKKAELKDVVADKPEGSIPLAGPAAEQKTRPSLEPKTNEQKRNLSRSPREGDHSNEFDAEKDGRQTDRKKPEDKEVSRKQVEESKSHQKPDDPGHGRAVNGHGNATNRPAADDDHNEQKSKASGSGNGGQAAAPKRPAAERGDAIGENEIIEVMEDEINLWVRDDRQTKKKPGPDTVATQQKMQPQAAGEVAGGMSRPPGAKKSETSPRQSNGVQQQQQQGRQKQGAGGAGGGKRPVELTPEDEDEPVEDNERKPSTFTGKSTLYKNP